MTGLVIELGQVLRPLPLRPAVAAIHLPHEGGALSISHVEKKQPQQQEQAQEEGARVRKLLGRYVVVVVAVVDVERVRVPPRACAEAVRG